MKKITNKEYEEYRKFNNDKNNGRILTPDGLRFICEANNMNPEQIGRYMLETLVKFRNEGVIK